MASSSTVVQDEVDRYPTPFVFTPALTTRLVRGGAAGFATYSFLLDHGASGVAAVGDAIFVAHLPPGETYNFHVTSVGADEVQQSLKPLSIAFWVFGAITVLGRTHHRGAGHRPEHPGQSARRRRLPRPRSQSDHDGGGFGQWRHWCAVARQHPGRRHRRAAFSPQKPVGAVRAVDPSPGFGSIGPCSAAVSPCSWWSWPPTRDWLPCAKRSASSAPPDPGARAARGSPTLAGTARAGGHPARRGHRHPVRTSAARDPTTPPSAPPCSAPSSRRRRRRDHLTFGNSPYTLVSHPDLYG